MSKSLIVLMCSTLIALGTVIMSASSSAWHATPIYPQQPQDPPHSNTQISIPDFGAMSDIPTLKTTFFNYLLPQIIEHNAHILKLRESVKLGQLTPEQLTALSQKYNTTPDQLLLHIDSIPPSLVLAQAAIESNWGRSRFAGYHNFFGIWCFSKGCGVIPKKRDADATHEVAIFKTPNDSLKYYVHMLNSHSAYKELRALRAQAREQSKTIGGIELSQGLLKYSGIGDKYITTIQKVIKYNHLSIYDTQ